MCDEAARASAQLRVSPTCLWVSLSPLARVTARTGDNLTGGCQAKTPAQGRVTLMEGERKEE